MTKLTKYILLKYLKFFIIVLISLEIFFVGIDYLQNSKKIPDSANLQLLYILYNSFFTLTLALPLSIVFAWIITLVVFIKNNEFVAFNALGASRNKLLNPILFSALICESTASIVVNFNLLLHTSCIFLTKSFFVVDLLFAISKNQFLRLQNQQSFFLVGEQSKNENLCS